MLRGTSTVNLKPQSVATLNIAPSSANTLVYAGYIDLDESNRYSDFKYSERTYGATTAYSVGQKMPAISTTEL